MKTQIRYIFIWFNWYKKKVTYLRVEKKKKEGKEALMKMKFSNSVPLALGHMLTILNKDKFL